VAKGHDAISAHLIQLNASSSQTWSVCFIQVPYG
jgi:hypothetical protein